MREKVRTRLRVITTIGIILAMVVMLCGCAANNAPPPAPTTKKPVVMIEVNSMKWATVEEVGLLMSAHPEVVVLDVTVSNLDFEGWVIVHTSQFKIIDGSGYTYEVGNGSWRPTFIQGAL